MNIFHCILLTNQKTYVVKIKFKRKLIERVQDRLYERLFIYYYVIIRTYGWSGIGIGNMYCVSKKRMNSIGILKMVEHLGARNVTSKTKISFFGFRDIKKS